MPQSPNTDENFEASSFNDVNKHLNSMIWLPQRQWSNPEKHQSAPWTGSPKPKGPVKTSVRPVQVQYGLPDWTNGKFPSQYLWFKTVMYTSIQISIFHWWLQTNLYGGSQCLWYRLEHEWMNHRNHEDQGSMMMPYNHNKLMPIIYGI